MRSLGSIFISLGLVLLLTAVAYLWLWFLFRRPEKWAAWVDAESAFWVRKGLASAAFAERLNRFEKGRPLRILVGTIALLGTVGLVFLVVTLARTGGAGR